jgi:hypothetical protein
MCGHSSAHVKKTTPQSLAQIEAPADPQRKFPKKIILAHIFP